MVILHGLTRVIPSLWRLLLLHPLQVLVLLSDFVLSLTVFYKKDSTWTAFAHQDGNSTLLTIHTTYGKDIWVTDSSTCSRISITFYFLI